MERLVATPEPKRPRIPVALYDPSLAWTLAFMAYALAMAILPGIAARAVAVMPLPLALRAAIVVPLAIVASQGFLLLGWFGHEGFHFSLHRSKVVSGSLGIFLSAMIPGYVEIGFAISHWNHHRFTNQASDPDCAHFRRFTSFWSRLFLARLTANATYMKNAWKLATGAPLPFAYKFPLPAPTVRRLAWLNFGATAFWIAVYAAVTVHDPLYALVAIVLPINAVNFLSGLQPYFEHAGTDHGTFRDTRSRTSPVFTALFFGNNYHLEHHLYPGVPCYRLPRIHRMLAASGLLGGAPVEPTVRGALLHATARSQYPAAGPTDDAHDPLLRPEPAWHPSPGVAAHARGAA